MAAANAMAIASAARAMEAAMAEVWVAAVAAEELEAAAEVLAVVAEELEAS